MALALNPPQREELDAMATMATGFPFPSTFWADFMDRPSISAIPSTFWAKFVDGATTARIRSSCAS